jgi:hypothetical protein
MPTVEQFDAYRGMFQWFNDQLFDGGLSGVMLNFSRQANTYGFLAPERWKRGDGAKAHEISINPDTLLDRDPRAVASTLVHEMVHAWQYTYGKPPRRGYHDRQWAAKMESIGLIPSHTGEPGGKRVGVRMTHYIDDDGRFAKVYAAMPPELGLPWRSWGPSAIERLRRVVGGAGGEPGGEPDPEGGDPTSAPAPRLDPSKVKYTCPGCAINTWGKEGLRIGCLDCGLPLVRSEGRAKKTRPREGEGEPQVPMFEAQASPS